jgi:hypothetical protein
MVNATCTGANTTVTRFGFEQIMTRHEGSKLEVITQPERSEQTFDTSPLAKLPSGLEGTLVVKFKKEPYTQFIDYEHLFHTALMLLHDDALELFLPQLQEQLELAQVCLGEVDAWVIQPSKNASFIDILFETKLDIPTDIDPFEKSHECCYCKGRMDSYYYCSRSKCKKVIVLFECSAPGRYETVFDVALESEQARLQRFLYFVTGAD